MTVERGKCAGQWKWLQVSYSGQPLVRRAGADHLGRSPWPGQVPSFRAPAGRRRMFHLTSSSSPQHGSRERIKTLQAMEMHTRTFIFMVNAFYTFLKNEILQVIVVQRCMKWLAHKNSKLENINGKWTSQPASLAALLCCFWLDEGNSLKFSYPLCQCVKCMQLD